MHKCFLNMQRSLRIAGCISAVYFQSIELLAVMFGMAEIVGIIEGMCNE